MYHSLKSNEYVFIEMKYVYITHISLDDFIPVYRQILHMDMVQIGYTSDPVKALEAFPEADVEYIFPSAEVLRFSKQELRERVKRLLDTVAFAAHRFSILVADLDVGTPDENVNEIYDCCKH